MEFILGLPAALFKTAKPMKGAASKQTNPAGQYFPPHTPVSEQTEPGIPEGGGLVMLKEEMSNPGKGVALYQGQRHQPPHRCDESHDKQPQGYRCADEVQPAGNSVGMLAKVERIKLFKRTVNLCFVHGDAFKLTLSHLRIIGLCVDAQQWITSVWIRVKNFHTMNFRFRAIQ